MTNKEFAKQYVASLTDEELCDLMCGDPEQEWEDDEMKYDELTDDDVIGFLGEISSYYASRSFDPNEERRDVNWSNACTYAIRRIRALEQSKKEIDNLLDANKILNRNDWRDGLMTGLAMALTTIEHYEKETE